MKIPITLLPLYAIFSVSLVYAEDEVFPMLLREDPPSLGHYFPSVSSPANDEDQRGFSPFVDRVTGLLEDVPNKTGAKFYFEKLRDISQYVREVIRKITEKLSQSNEGLLMIEAKYDFEDNNNSSPQLLSLNGDFPRKFKDLEDVIDEHIIKWKKNDKASQVPPPQRDSFENETFLKEFAKLGETDFFRIFLLMMEGYRDALMLFQHPNSPGKRKIPLPFPSTLKASLPTSVKPSDDYHLGVFFISAAFCLVVEKYHYWYKALSKAYEKQGGNYVRRLPSTVFFLEAHDFSLYSQSLFLRSQSLFLRALNYLSQSLGLSPQTSHFSIKESGTRNKLVEIIENSGSEWFSGLLPVFKE